MTSCTSGRACGPSERNTSLSALAKGCLDDLAADESEEERHRWLPNELLQRLDAQRREVIVAERLDHDALHQRG